MAASRFAVMSASAPRSATAWAFLLPALLLIGLSVLIPAAMALVMSFSQSGLDVSEPLRFIGLANVRRLLADPMVARVSVTTFLYLVGVVPPVVLGALGLAVLVNRQLPGMHWFRGAFYTPVLVSIVVAAIAFRWLYAETGLINSWLAALLGDRFSPIGFLTSPLLALPSVMLVTLWKGLGYSMVIFLAGLQGISPDLYEAAALDGSEGWRRHLDITLPLLRPYVFLVLLFRLAQALGVFDLLLVLTGGGPAGSSESLALYAFLHAMRFLDFGYSATVMLGMFLLLLAGAGALLLWQQRAEVQR